MANTRSKGTKHPVVTHKTSTGGRRSNKMGPSGDNYATKNRRLTPKSQVYRYVHHPDPTAANCPRGYWYYDKSETGKLPAGCWAAGKKHMIGWRKRNKGKVCPRGYRRTGGKTGKIFGGCTKKNSGKYEDAIRDYRWSD